ncbi:MAG: glycosyltransferase family 2 protein [Saprospiraceae bacterium]|nr:glycosyltransferase family 2 protein [Saprospiraceae bacterium]
MSGKKFRDLWKFSEARDVRPLDHFVMLLLVSGGIASTYYLGEWWFRKDHVASLPLFVILSTFFWYAVWRNFLIWINYLRISKPDHVPAPEKGLRVAVFTTSAPGEPLSMFEKTLSALSRVTYPHKTYLLDSTKDPSFRALAEQHGVVWLELNDLPGAKAGKINEALNRTDEDFILILDPDHIVFPNFLDQTLGFFKDPDVGFVQVSQGYYNQYRSFVAAAAAEQTYNFYGPTQMGLYGYGTAVAIGANCTFRRTALESIGGHAVGLAEDLLTSIRLHAKGWRSVYNPVIVSRGLVPEDFGSFCKQQLKWARGVFEILFTELPARLGRLTFWQKLSYLGIGTYYLTGAITLFFILVPFIYFFTGTMPAKMNFAEFIVNGSFLVIMASLIYFYAQRFLCHPKTERGFHWRSMIIKFSCWPVYFLGFVLGVLDYKLPYIPTAKKAVRGKISPFSRPLIIYCVIFIITVIIVIINRRYFVPESELIFTAEKTWGMIGFSFLAFLLSIVGIMAAWESLALKEEEPWQNVALDKIEIPKK